MAVGDPYNRSLFTKAVPDTPTNGGGKFRSVWLVETIIMVGLMAVSNNGTRRAIREYKRAHGLPEDGTIG